MKIIIIIRKSLKLPDCQFSLLSILLLFSLLMSCSKVSDDELPQPLNGERYLQPIFPLFNQFSNIQYGENYTQSGVLKELRFDFFEPRDDEATRRPLIIMAKGIGFVDVSREDFDLLAEFLTQFGYTVANLDYRIDDRGIFPIDTLTSYDNLIKARSDIKEAIRSFRLEAQGQNRFRTDPDRIFLLGYSAGAIAVLHAAYLNEGDNISPLVDSLIAQNGGWEGNNGPDEGNSQPNAVINLSGALLDAGYINENEPPLFSIHGQMDQFIPVCKGQIRAAEFLEPVSMEGSCVLHEHALAVGLKSELIAPEAGGHDVSFAENACPDCFPRLLLFLFELL